MYKVSDQRLKHPPEDRQIPTSVLEVYTEACSFFVEQGGAGEGKPKTTFLVPDNIPLSSLISPQLFCLKALGACGEAAM